MTYQALSFRSTTPEPICLSRTEDKGHRRLEARSLARRGISVTVTPLHPNLSPLPRVKTVSLQPRGRPGRESHQCPPPAIDRSPPPPARSARHTAGGRSDNQSKFVRARCGSVGRSVFHAFRAAGGGGEGALQLNSLPQRNISSLISHAVLNGNTHAGTGTFKKKRLLAMREGGGGTGGVHSTENPFLLL
ncbi:hypothetical protein LX36DRAFT_323976 [Colletotrichum falcatum]|nr:hypothetical protein LX36DRAFT_323976 [Colletotrichum falcatum]